MKKLTISLTAFTVALALASEAQNRDPRSGSDRGPNSGDRRPDRPDDRRPGRPDDRRPNRSDQELNHRHEENRRRRADNQYNRDLYRRRATERSRDRRMIEEIRRRKAEAFRRPDYYRRMEAIVRQETQYWIREPRTEVAGFGILSDYYDGFNYNDPFNYEISRVVQSQRYQKVKLLVIGDGAYLHRLTLNFCQKTLLDRLQPSRQSILLDDFYPEGDSTEWIDVGTARCLENFIVHGLGDRDDGRYIDDTYVVLLGKKLL